MAGQKQADLAQADRHSSASLLNLIGTQSGAESAGNLLLTSQAPLGVEPTVLPKWAEAALDCYAAARGRG